LPDGWTTTTTPDCPRVPAAQVVAALGRLGREADTRNELFALLQAAEARAHDDATFRDRVRWPLIQAALRGTRHHRVRLKSGLLVEVAPASRIERALLLSRDSHPDHVWEPQTTRLLTILAARTTTTIVGGAYIGDQVLPMAGAIRRTPVSSIHAFEPVPRAFRALRRNLELNGLRNVVPRRLALWDRSGKLVTMSGAPALATCTPVGRRSARSDLIKTVAIDDYVRREGLRDVGLLMLDLEGAETRALSGARRLLSLPRRAAPAVIFEIHRHHTDWSRGLRSTPQIELLTSLGYTVFAIRDFHDNVDMAGRPIEIVPIDCVYLGGPPHGFNLLATRERDLPARLGLKVVRGVSPKLIWHKDPRLHHPRH
jgi:FkbM family methyltransferase